MPGAPVTLLNSYQINKKGVTVNSVTPWNNTSGDAGHHKIIKAFSTKNKELINTLLKKRNYIHHHGGMRKIKLPGILQNLTVNQVQRKEEIQQAGLPMVHCCRRQNSLLNQQEEEYFLSCQTAEISNSSPPLAKRPIYYIHVKGYQCVSSAWSGLFVYSSPMRAAASTCWWRAGDLLRMIESVSRTHDRLQKEALVYYRRVRDEIRDFVQQLPGNLS